MINIVLLVKVILKMVHDYTSEILKVWKNFA